MAAFLAAAKAMNGKNEDSSASVQQTVTTVSTSKLDCPFNLDEIFQADVERFGSLKQVIKFIIENIEKTNVKVTDLDVKMA